MKLNLGCGSNHRAGYVNVDADPGREPDVVADIRRLPDELTDAEEVLAIHVLEHFPIGELTMLLKHWRSRMRPGARLVIECPGLDGYARALLDGSISPWQFNTACYERGLHKAFLNASAVIAMCSSAGFHGMREERPLTHGKLEHLNLRVEAIA